MSDSIPETFQSVVFKIFTYLIIKHIKYYMYDDTYDKVIERVLPSINQNLSNKNQLTIFF